MSSAVFPPASDEICERSCDTCWSGACTCANHSFVPLATGSTQSTEQLDSDVADCVGEAAEIAGLADVALAGVVALDPQAARLRTAAPASAPAAMIFFITWIPPKRTASEALISG